jgi:hypothetical protein
MNTPVSTPRMRASRLSTANGENHDSSGVSAPPLTSATIANISRAPTWNRIRIRCRSADSSVPSTQIVVIAPMMISVNTTFQNVESRRLSASIRSKV